MSAFRASRTLRLAHAVVGKPTHSRLAAVVARSALTHPACATSGVLGRRGIESRAGDARNRPKRADARTARPEVADADGGADDTTPAHEAEPGSAVNRLPSAPKVTLASTADAAAAPSGAASAAISVLEMFSIGIGPSSSHTVGPMRAAHRFASLLARAKDEAGAPLLDSVTKVKVGLYGSLALTGIGHGTLGAVMLGLEGNLPHTVDVDAYPARLEAITKEKRLSLNAEAGRGAAPDAAGAAAPLMRKTIEFDPHDCLPMYKREVLPLHSNGMQFTAFDAEGKLLLLRRFYSIGGGFFVGDQGAKTDDSLAAAGALSGTTSHSREAAEPPFPFRRANDLLATCNATGLGVADVAMANELAWELDDDEKYPPLDPADTAGRAAQIAAAREVVVARLMGLWGVMDACIDRGLHTTGTLPGGLHVRRRAPGLRLALEKRQRESHARSTRHTDAFHGMPIDAVSMWAIAVNEENAAGGRVVTAPTNGAAGIIPAVLKYYITYVHPHQRSGGATSSDDAVAGGVMTTSRSKLAEVLAAAAGSGADASAMADTALALTAPGGGPITVTGRTPGTESPIEAMETKVCEFLLTAGVVGMLFKSGASISAAEVGCQGEVGVACSMAAAALCAVSGGSVAQVESAAEIGMEHNLGLTCDPVSGLVQVPCIERNVMGAVKAITASRLAMSNTFDVDSGGHVPLVSLDNVIKVMLATGRDMQTRYKETSEAGLSSHITVNLPEC